jgi:hypothetical protein
MKYLKATIHWTLLIIQILVLLPVATLVMVVAAPLMIIEWLWKWSQPERPKWRYHCPDHHWISQDGDCPICEELGL